MMRRNIIRRPPAMAVVVHPLERKILTVDKQTMTDILLPKHRDMISTEICCGTYVHSSADLNLPMWTYVKEDGTEMVFHGASYIVGTLTSDIDLDTNTETNHMFNVPNIHHYHIEKAVRF